MAMITVSQKIYCGNSNWKGCLMVSLPSSIAADVQEFGHKSIADENLAEDGFENYIHTTLLYGFKQTIATDDVRQFVQSQGFDKVALELGKIKRFKANEQRPESDVIIIEVISDDLVELNRRLKNSFEIENDYPIYNPHVTIAYVKPDTCLALDGLKPFAGMQVESDSFVYSRGLISYNDVINECRSR